MTQDELRRIAAELGLVRLQDAHLQQLEAGIASNRALAARLPKNLHWTDEPAHVFRLAPVKESGR